MADPPHFKHPPPVAPEPESPASGQPPGRSRDNSHDGDSQFSCENPLQGDAPVALVPAEPKKPKAVALHGWQRTVGVDEDFDPTIPVCLGAPGTGLFTAKAGQHNPGAVGMGVGAVVDLGNAKVTREDKKEAKTLRLQPAAPDAAPLPYPRVAAVDTESESSSEATDDDDPTGSRRKRQDNNHLETCSEASSDMSFLVNATSGAFLGNRGAFGRNIDPRIPATVGEEQLYNSLAEYFGKSRRNIIPAGGGDADEPARGESRLSDSSGGAASGEKDLLLRQGGRVGSSSTPTIAGKAAGATPGSITNSTTLSTSGGSGSTMNTNNSQTASIPPVDQQHHPKKKSLLRVRSRSGEARRGGGGEGESKGREGSSRGSGGGALVTEAMVEEGRLAKEANGEAAPVEPGRRLPKCKCLRRWPWKFLSGVVTLTGLVAVVVLVVPSTAGGSSNSSGDTPRGSSWPQLPLTNGGSAPGSVDPFLLGNGWRSGGGRGGSGASGGAALGGSGVGGALQAGLGHTGHSRHSRRILSVDGVDDAVEPAAVAGDGGDGAAAGIADAGGDAGAASAGAADVGAFGPQLTGEPPGRGREREAVAVAIDVDGSDAPVRTRSKEKPVR
eukprot:g8156.t1